MLVVATVLLGGFFAAYSVAKNDADHISNDSENKFCRTDFLPEITVVVIDHTDKISPIQKKSLEQRLWDVANNVKKNGALRFYSVTEDEEQALGSEFELCNPGSPASLNKLTSNEKLARKKYEDQFSSVLKENLDGILTAETAPRSLIMRSVQAAAVSSLIGESNAAGRKRLIVVSDLLEHSGEFSLYKGVPSFEQFKKDAYWPAVKADLEGVDVELFYLHRSGAENIQTPELKQFWQMYFASQGANSVNFVPVEG